MNARNCKKCGKIFNYVFGAPICPACKEELEEKFKEVKEYVREHKGCSVAEVCEECDVDQKQIQQWIREERLEFAAGLGVFCEKCGMSIPNGRFCEKCKVEMANTFSQASAKPVTPQKPADNSGHSTQKMRFLDR